VKDVFWDRPVRVGGALIFGPLTAQEFMVASWPQVQDQNCAVASAAIVAALAGQGSPDVARERFEMALKSAHIR
jgi:hypothetical protein